MEGKQTAIVLLAALICFTFAAVSESAVDWQVIKTLDLEAPPADMAISPDGMWIYVLTTDGKLLVYTGDGRYKKTLDVGDGVTDVETGPGEGMLYLTSRDAKTLRILSVDLEYDFELAGSPTKGPTAAPVVIAVFSDFE